MIEEYFVHQHKNGKIHELAVDGAKTKVNDDNKFLYSLVKTEYLTKEIVHSQLKSLKRGFNRLIPESWVNEFTEEELERIVCGKSKISLSEWQKYT